MIPTFDKALFLHQEWNGKLEVTASSNTVANPMPEIMLDAAKAVSKTVKAHIQ